MRIIQDKQIPIYVLEELEEEVISSYYNNLLYRHPSIIKTIELIKQYYKFLNMQDNVSKFIKNYISY
jgi:hypothetical protein